MDPCLIRVNRLLLNDCLTVPPGSFCLPLESLVPTRARPEGIARARELMRQAAAGQIPKRGPLAVRRRPDGRWDVLDGNSTYAVALELGWPEMRCVETL